MCSKEGGEDKVDEAPRLARGRIKSGAKLPPVVDVVTVASLRVDLPTS